jgi:thioredoxin reductase (NADPH)
MKMGEQEYDVIIIGAGPAGLTAGIYCARNGLKTLILEEKLPGGLAAEASLIENYPGFIDGVSGLDLVNRMVKQAKKFAVEINELEPVLELTVKGKKKIVQTEKKRYTTSAIILSSGCHCKHLNVVGESLFQGKGVSYCAVCDGPLFRNRHLIVVGGGNSAAMSALYLSELAAEVKLIHRREGLRAEDALIKDLKRKSVKVMLNTEIDEIKGEQIVKEVILFNNKTEKMEEVPVDGIFIHVGETPNSKIAKEAGIDTDSTGFVIVDPKQQTNIEGVYAAGDVTNCEVKQIGTAVGQAIIAALEVFGFLKRPYYYQRS